MKRGHKLEQTEKIRSLLPTRSLDCMHYSHCLMQAAQKFSSSKAFSCAKCQSYELEKTTDWDKLLETVRALKLFEAIWEDEESALEPVWISSAPSRSWHTKSYSLKEAV